MDSCDDGDVLVGSECRSSCPSEMYVEEGKCVKQCSPGSAKEDSDSERRCNKECLYYQDGDQARCVQGNTCPQGKNFLKDGRECVSICPDIYDIVDGNYVCTKADNSAQDGQQETPAKACENFINGGVCALTCDNEQYYYVGENNSRICTETCPTPFGDFLVVDYFTTINGTPQCVHDCGDAYEENRTCVRHCSSGCYQVNSVTVNDEVSSTRLCIEKENCKYFIREALMVRCLPEECAIAGGDYRYTN